MLILFILCSNCFNFYRHLKIEMQIVCLKYNIGYLYNINNGGKIGHFNKYG